MVRRHTRFAQSQFYVTADALYIRSRSLYLPHYDSRFHDKTQYPRVPLVLLVSIAWMYVVVMVAVVQALSGPGGMLNALLTLVFGGALPLGIVAYLFFSPARARVRRAREAAPPASGPDRSVPGIEADGGVHPPCDPVAPVGEET